ncbi:bifunctional DNA primase/polymerase [Natrinema gelatinilyticum]|uniref:bifunctional DNA primase/polymerase n=1 Tax=Natrinema gelatinilyticum TaxID=2961571 RepID=UPI0020C4B822|nr:bifunctional DNA primase/polymerase [Natrinema gelatinilyticum]
MISSDTQAAVGAELHRQRERLTDRLQEVDLDSVRAVDLPNGGKRNDHDHTDPGNHYRPGEIEGNYGIMGGNGLVVIDIDDHDDRFEGLPDDLNALPPTLTVQTPHGGEHRYYATDTDLRSTRFPGVDVQGVNSYVLGPGSVLNQCSKSWHNCSAKGEGQYQIKRDRPIASLGTDTLEVLSKSQSSQDELDQDPPIETPDLVCQDLEIAIAGIEADFNPVRVFQKMMNGKKSQRNQNLINGQYAKTEYQNDRSRAESALVEELGWWFGDDKEIVWRIMDLICQLSPQTDTDDRRKWLERNDSWRETLFDNSWFGDRDTYNPHTMRSLGEERPQVSKPTKKFVLEAIHEMGAATSREIADHPRVDRGHRQVQRALKELEEQEIIDWEKQGNIAYHYPANRPDLL